MLIYSHWNLGTSNKTNYSSLRIVAGFSSIGRSSCSAVKDRAMCKALKLVVKKINKQYQKKMMFQKWINVNICRHNLFSWQVGLPPNVMGVPAVVVVEVDVDVDVDEDDV